MKKISRLILFTIVMLVGMTGVNLVVDKMLNPEVSTSLALEQFANPSVVTDTTQRVYNSDWLVPLNVIGLALVGSVWVLSYREEIGELMQ